MLNVRLSDVWDNIVAEMISLPRNKNIWSITRRLVCSAAVYYIWQERNNRLFKREERSVETVLKIVIQAVEMKLMGLLVKDSKTVKEVEPSDTLDVNGITTGKLETYFMGSSHLESPVRNHRSSRKSPSSLSKINTSIERSLPIYKVPKTRQSLLLLLAGQNRNLQATPSATQGQGEKATLQNRDRRSGRDVDHNGSGSSKSRQADHHRNRHRSRSPPRDEVS
ncbi:hypothetical protein Tco_1280579, partial [Tanacetum coccineum]